MSTPERNLQLASHFQVQATLEKYIEGLRTGNVELLKSIFDPHARLHGYLMGNFVNGPLDMFLADVASRPPPVESGEPFRASIVSIHVIGRIATATVVEESYFGLNFMDQFQLLETDRGWIIVDKLFHHEPPAANRRPS